MNDFLFGKCTCQEEICLEICRIGGYSVMLVISIIGRELLIFSGSIIIPGFFKDALDFKLTPLLTTKGEETRNITRNEFE